MIRGREHPSFVAPPVVLRGARVSLRALTGADWLQWQDVRARNHDWLTPWEPQRPSNLLDPPPAKDGAFARGGPAARTRQA